MTIKAWICRLCESPCILIMDESKISQADYSPDTCIECDCCGGAQNAAWEELTITDLMEIIS